MPEIIDNLVVGTGPTGIAAALALLEAGKEVCLIDPGITLEPDVLPRIEGLRAKSVEEWQSQDLQFLSQRLRLSAGAFETKLSYGSDYCYRWSDPATDLDSQQRPTIKASYSPGGLSQVWGGGVLPFSEDDLAGWPIGFNELRPHYAPVLRLIPYAADDDDFDGAHPLHAGTIPALQLSRTSQAFLDHVTRHRDALHARGVTIARSRLAVRSGDCRYCGLCLYGCPFGLIWSSDMELRELSARFGPRFRYERGWIVDQVQEREGFVDAICLDPDSASSRVLVARRVFIAAGVLQTTKIIVKSLNLYDCPVRLKDSQYFVFPFLRWHRVPGVARERLSTLAQLFLRTRQATIAPRSVLISIYSFNEDILRLLESRLRLFGPLGPLLARYLAGRLMIFAGYLHSDLSSSLEFRLTRTHERKSTITLSSRIEPGARETACRVVRTLTGLSRWLGGRPLLSQLQVGDPGTAYHYGGSFPMTREPHNAFESDLLGRPRGLRRVFIVDASNFPTIPASTITVNAMANAHRIASHAAREVP